MPRRSHWKAIADDVLREIFMRAPADITDRELRVVLVMAYPFGERKMWPYKCWLSRRRAWLYAFRAGLRSPVNTDNVTRTDRVTLPLFP